MRGKNRKQGKSKPVDPSRAKRIHAQREREAALRGQLDTLMKQTREMADRTHYSRLGKETASAAKPILDELRTLYLQVRDRLAACHVENFSLDIDCRALEERLQSLRGGNPKPGLSEEMLNGLPQNQADAVRFAVAFTKAKLPHPEAQVRVAFDAATEHLEQIKSRLDALDKLTAEILAVGREKARRGWCATEEIEGYATAGQQYRDAQRLAVEDYERQLAAAIARRDELLNRRDELNKTVAEVKR